LSNQLSCSISDIALLGRATASSEVIATTQAGSLGHDREDGNEASLLDSILDGLLTASTLQAGSHWFESSTAHPAAAARLV
jgi:hypothetical protein